MVEFFSLKTLLYPPDSIQAQRILRYEFPLCEFYRVTFTEEPNRMAQILISGSCYKRRLAVKLGKSTHLQSNGFAKKVVIEKATFSIDGAALR